MKSITVQQLRERTGVPLIDVREVDEFAAGHVAQMAVGLADEGDGGHAGRRSALDGKA